MEQAEEHAAREDDSDLFPPKCCREAKGLLCNRPADCPRDPCRPGGNELPLISNGDVRRSPSGLTSADLPVGAGGNAGWQRSNAGGAGKSGTLALYPSLRGSVDAGSDASKRSASKRDFQESP